MRNYYKEYFNFWCAVAGIECFFLNHSNPKKNWMHFFFKKEDQAGHVREKQLISNENICKSGIQSYVYDNDFNNLNKMNKWVY